MTGLAGRLRAALVGDDRPDADRLATRVEAVGRFLRAVEHHLPEERLVGARTVVERAEARLALSRDHTLVALAGATGSGKSSLFNALAGSRMSPVGVRRPTTGVTHACVWGPLAEARRLLDWVGVLPQHRFVRVNSHEDEAALTGLVLLDLPDFDSVQRSHRLEVDRMLRLVDLMVWVVDPQKYADRLVHHNYLRHFHRHKDVTVVVLNQADLLAPAELPRVVDDLRRLLDDDGLGGVPVLATSAVNPASLTDLRAVLARTVAQRQAALRRLAGDIDEVAAQLTQLMGPPAVKDAVDRATTRQLDEALAASAGVAAVAEATEDAYRHRAAGLTGWPLVRGLRKLRPDPLRRLHLPTPEGGRGPSAAAGSLVAATSVPDPTAAQRSAVNLAVRAVADKAAAGLPDNWSASVVAAARSRLNDLPDALDRAVATTDLGLDRTPVWWRLVGVVQWLAMLSALAGLGWLLAGYAIRVLGLPSLDYPMVGLVPVPTLLLLGGLLLGLLLAVAVRPIITAAARRARRRAETRLRAAMTQVGNAYVVVPVRAVLRHYAEARDALTAIRSPR